MNRTLYTILKHILKILIQRACDTVNSIIAVIMGPSETSWTSEVAVLQDSHSLVCKQIFNQFQTVATG